jgi:hypothetical protein
MDGTLMTLKEMIYADDGMVNPYIKTV